MSNEKKRGSWIELSEDIKYDNPWIKVTEHQVINPRGGKGIYGQVHFKNLAIGIIPIDENWNTWIVGQDRFPFDGKFTWEIIEGGGPLDHLALDSAKRELREEAGLIASTWTEIQRMDLSNSTTTERAIIYLAQGLKEVEKDPDDTEDLVIKKISFDSLLEMVLSGEIVDSLSVAAALKLDYLRKNKPEQVGLKK